MRVGFVQIRPKLGDVEFNVRHAIKMLRRAYKKEAELIVLPELFNTGYLYTEKKEIIKVAEEVPEGFTSRELMKASDEYSMCIVAGIAEKSGENVYNSAIIVNNGEFLGVYRKMHLFYLEKKIFKAGDLGFKVFDIGKAKIGVLICFDWIFPEATRVLALKGAEIICHSANLVLPYAQTAMLVRSIENRIYIITANRVGEEKKGDLHFRFTGLSQVTSPDMKVLVRASRTREEVRVVEIDLKMARDKKITELNDIFKDRRVNFYREILEEHVLV